MKPKFEAFLSRLETEQNATLIDTIRKGYKAVNEGYADVVEDTVSPIDSFNRMSVMASSNMGNKVMSFLQNSSDTLSHLYTEGDDEPELDRITSVFDQHFQPEDEIIPRDEITEDLGLTASDLSRRL